MRLIDLAPRWFTIPQCAPGIDVRIGLTFLCPHCRTQRLGVQFTPPLDREGVFATLGIKWPFGDGPVWQREGDTFETITLTPSIDASGRERIDFDGHWHGFVRNGEVT